MSATLDNNITVDVTSDAPTTPSTGLGTPLAVGAQGAGFTELIRFYDNNNDVVADTDLGASVAAMLTAMFSQKIKPSKAAAGKLVVNVAQIDNIVISAGVAEDDVFNVTVAGVLYSFTALAAPTPASVSAGLQALINAGPESSVVDNTGNIDITATPAGRGLATIVDYDNTIGGGTSGMVLATTTLNVGMFSQLDAIKAASNDWYGLVNERRVDIDILEAARWTEANKKLHVPQSSDVLIKTAASTTDAAFVLKSLSYDRTALLYYGDDAVFADAAWMGFKLAADLDSEADTNSVTIWIYATLIGVAIDVLTTTEKNAILGKNANVYLTLNKVGATGDGKLASGRDIDKRTTLDWLEIRMFEDLAAQQLNASNANTKIPFTSRGIAAKESTLKNRLNIGERIGHLSPGKSTVTVPTIDKVTVSDKDNGILRASFVAEFSGAITKPKITGNVVTQL